MAEAVLSDNRSRLPVRIVVKKILFRLSLAVIVQYFAEIASGNSVRTDNQFRLHVKKPVSESEYSMRRVFYVAQRSKSRGRDYCRYGSGLTSPPPCLTSKCTCGPVVLPVKPTVPITVLPADTLSPGFTLTAFI